MATTTDGCFRLVEPMLQCCCSRPIDLAPCERGILLLTSAHSMTTHSVTQEETKTYQEATTYNSTIRSQYSSTQRCLSRSLLVSPCLDCPLFSKPPRRTSSSFSLPSPTWVPRTAMFTWSLTSSSVVLMVSTPGRYRVFSDRSQASEEKDQDQFWQDGWICLGENMFVRVLFSDRCSRQYHWTSWCRKGPWAQTSLLSRSGFVEIWFNGPVKNNNTPGASNIQGQGLGRFNTNASIRENYL